MMTVTRPITKKRSRKINKVIINDASIKPSIAIKIVESMIPEVHTDFLLLNVPYEKNANRDAKTNQVMVDNNVPKCNIGYNSESPVCSQLEIGS